LTWPMRKCKGVPQVFESEQTRLENAAAVLEAERARLVRPDGTRLSDPDHAERD
jgi:hypothetical protein